MLRCSRLAYYPTVKLMSADSAHASCGVFVQRGMYVFVLQVNSPKVLADICSRSFGFMNNFFRHTVTSLSSVISRGDHCRLAPPWRFPEASRSLFLFADMSTLEADTTYVSPRNVVSSGDVLWKYVEDKVDIGPPS